ncbi:transposase [Belnapia arida]
MTLWLDEDALITWQAPRWSTSGGQAWYSDAAIELVLMLRLVFHLALRRAEGFAKSVLRLLGQTLRVPDHTMLSRRSRNFARRQPKIAPHGPPHLAMAQGFGGGAPGEASPSPARLRRSVSRSRCRSASSPISSFSLSPTRARRSAAKLSGCAASLPT